MKTIRILIKCSVKYISNNILFETQLWQTYPCIHPCAISIFPIFISIIRTLMALANFVKRSLSSVWDINRWRMSGQREEWIRPEEWHRSWRRSGCGGGTDMWWRLGRDREHRSPAGWGRTGQSSGAEDEPNPPDETQTDSRPAAHKQPSLTHAAITIPPAKEYYGKNTVTSYVILQSNTVKCTDFGR